MKKLLLLLLVVMGDHSVLYSEDNSASQKLYYTTPKSTHLMLGSLTAITGSFFAASCWNELYAAKNSQEKIREAVWGGIGASLIIGSLAQFIKLFHPNTVTPILEFTPEHLIFLNSPQKEPLPWSSIAAYEIVNTKLFILDTGGTIHCILPYEIDNPLEEVYELIQTYHQAYARRTIDKHQASIFMQPKINAFNWGLSASVLGGCAIAGCDLAWNHQTKETVEKVIDVLMPVGFAALSALCFAKCKNVFTEPAFVVDSEKITYFNQTVLWDKVKKLEVKKITTRHDYYYETHYEINIRLIKSNPLLIDSRYIDEDADAILWLLEYYLQKSQSMKS